MLVVLLLCCASALWFVRQWRLERLTANIPTLSGALPIIGHAHKLVGNGEHVWKFLQSTENEVINRGGIMKAWLGPTLVFVVTEPKIAQTLLNTFEEKMYTYKFLTSWLNQGLFTADVSEWRRHRKLINPTFNQSIINGYLQTFNRMSVKLVEKIEKELSKGEFDMTSYFKNITLEAICQTALGLSTTETIKTHNNEYIDAVEKMLHIVTTRINHIWMHPSSLYNWTKMKNEEDDVVKYLKRISSTVLNAKKAEMMGGLSKQNENPGKRKYRTSTNYTYAPGGPIHNETLVKHLHTVYTNVISGKGKMLKRQNGRSMKNFLDYLLELQSQGLLSDQEITDEVDTMIFAGTDTTANTMIFVLIVLASYPDVQDRVYNEIQDVLGDSTYCCDVNISDLTKFVYLEAVLKETMRMYPIAPFVARKVHRNYYQDNLCLPSGSVIGVIISGVNKSDCWGNDAQSFKPERWLSGSLPDNPAAFASFSLGRRSCIGRYYAMVLMKTSLVHLLRRYQLTKNETKLRLKWDLMLTPAAGHLLSIELRQ